MFASVIAEGMNMKWIFFLGCYMAAFVLLIFGVTSWDRRRRRTRKPFPENLKLLRMNADIENWR